MAGLLVARACTAAIVGIVCSNPDTCEYRSQQPPPCLVRLISLLLLCPFGTLPCGAPSEADHA